MHRGIVAPSTCSSRAIGCASLHECEALKDGGTHFDRLQSEWRTVATRLTSTNEDVYRLFQQSVEDMGALRLYDQDFAPDVWLPAAGVPWFVTIFGRDSLIVSHQNMIIHPLFARGALQKLAEYQAREMDDWRDAEPGKILHELRFGELAHFHQIPTPYYGTADATILYPIVLHEAWKWLGDQTLIHQYRDVVLRCLGGSTPMGTSMETASRSTRRVRASGTKMSAGRTRATR